MNLVTFWFGGISKWFGGAPCPPSWREPWLLVSTQTVTDLIYTGLGMILHHGEVLVAM